MKKIQLLDGGMGRELKKKVKHFDPFLWAAGALISDPDYVIDVHKSFINAGAQIITTNNYTVVPYVLEESNIMNQFSSLTKKAGLLAKEAVKQSGNHIKIAGCLPPLKLTYRPDLVEKDTKKAISIYKQIIDYLDPYTNLFLAESISSLQELNYIIEATKTCSKPIYVACLLNDEKPTQLLDNTNVADLIPIINKSHINGLLFNCSQPKSITTALTKMKTLKIAYGGYGNAFKPLKKEFQIRSLREEAKDLSIKKYTSHVNTWIELGATIVGGCCGIGPNYIKDIHRLINEANT